jgi:hypothetical protein
MASSGLYSFINFIGHVITGFLIVYLFLPFFSTPVQFFVVLVLASWREYDQEQRGTHPQTFESRVSDVLEFLLGALIAVVLISNGSLNPDDKKFLSAEKDGE